MEQRNTSMSVAGSSMRGFAIPQQSPEVMRVGLDAKMHLPLRRGGDNLGLGSEQIHVYIVDALGSHFKTESIEWLLRHIECFAPGRDQVQLLAGVAIHYGLDVYALMGADFEAKFNVLDNSGAVLLADVSHLTACAFADNYADERGYGAAGEFSLSIQRASRDTGDERHEGPLVLLHHNLGVTDFEGIAVKSHAGRCGMMLEEVLWRLDQFSAADQAEILGGLAKHFDMGDACAEVAGAA